MHTSAARRKYIKLYKHWSSDTPPLAVVQGDLGICDCHMFREIWESAIAIYIMIAFRIGYIAHYHFIFFTLVTFSRDGAQGTLEDHFKVQAL